MADEVQGTVTAKNDTGIKIDGQEGWKNFSKPEFRGSPYEIPNKGDTVKVTLSGDDLKYVKSIEIVGAGQQTGNGASAPSEPRPSQSVNGDQWGRKWALENSLKFYELRGDAFSDDDVIETALKFAGLFD